MTEREIIKQIACKICGAVCNSPLIEDAIPCQLELARANKIHAVYKANGYVQLDNQELPINEWGDTELNRGWRIAQKVMLNDGYRRIKVTLKECPECHGRGISNSSDFDQNYEPCERCGGSGGIKVENEK